MTTKTTAKDWRLVDERGAGGFLYIERGYEFDFLQVEPEEHARLIAAAPAMLAALQEWLALTERMAALHPSRDLREVLPNPAGLSARIRAAIAAAEAAGITETA